MSSVVYYIPDSVDFGPSIAEVDDNGRGTCVTYLIIYSSTIG